MTCLVEKCNNNIHCKGYCNKHYNKYKTYGDPLFGRDRNCIHEKHNMTGTSEYNTWKSMKRRCYSNSDKSFKNYGGRGITVCDRWKNSFLAFYEDMGKRPNNMSLDRIDNNKGYSKDNCRWTNNIIQARNQRTSSLNKSGCRGVYYRSDIDKWRAIITVNKNRISLGSFKLKKDAVRAREEAEKKFWK